MHRVWDYNPEELEKTKEGRLKLLERLINYGVYPSDKVKLPINEIKKYWTKLKIDKDRRRFLKLIIWGK